MIALYSLALLVSAALPFLLEPMVGKFVPGIDTPYWAPVSRTALDARTQGSTSSTRTSIPARARRRWFSSTRSARLPVAGVTRGIRPTWRVDPLLEAGIR